MVNQSSECYAFLPMISAFVFSRSLSIAGIRWEVCICSWAYKSNSTFQVTTTKEFYDKKKTDIIPVSASNYILKQLKRKEKEKRKKMMDDEENVRKITTPLTTLVALMEASFHCPSAES